MSAIEYVSPLTSKLNPDNWEEQINPADLSLDEATDLLADLKKMEAFGKKVGGFVKELVRAKVPMDEFDEAYYVGSHFSVAVKQRTRAGGLNKPLILEEMGEEWVEEHSLPATEYSEVRIKPVTTE